MELQVSNIIRESSPEHTIWIPRNTLLDHVRLKAGYAVIVQKKTTADSKHVAAKVKVVREASTTLSTTNLTCTRADISAAFACSLSCKQGDILTILRTCTVSRNEYLQRRKTSHIEVHLIWVAGKPCSRKTCTCIQHITSWTKIGESLRLLDIPIL